jgi:hypothetical protein
MIVEFRNSTGDVVERQSTGGDSIEIVAASQAQYEQRMLNLGCPPELAKRAAGRSMRALANPRLVSSSLPARIAAANAAVETDRAVGFILDETDADFRKRMLTAAARFLS